MKYWIIVVSLLLGACTTIQERLAKRVACNPDTVIIQDEVIAPGYSEWAFTCDGRSWTCSDKPFYNSCSEGGRATLPSKTKGKKSKKKKKKKK
jgi:hypothetical protein